MTTRSERGLRPERVAEIIVSLADKGESKGRRGSGYLVAPGTVLTAEHVVAGAVGVRVRFQAGRAGERLVEATVAWTDRAVDVAVLTLPEDAADDVPPVSVGRIGEQDAVLRCTAMGFPRFKLRTDADGRRFRDAEHVDATCAVLANRREGTLDLRVTAPPAEDPNPKRDAWEGMSGAAVFSGGHLVGVVSRHHRNDGLGRIAAGRADRWAEALDTTQQAALERLLGGGKRGVRLSALPSAAPPTGPALLQEAYRAQLADVAPQRLEEREGFLAELVSFCAGPDPYLWLQGRPWAGKTALVAWFAQHPPRSVVPVWFFVTGRQVGQADSEAYTVALIDQLAAIAGSEPAVGASPAVRDGERRRLLREAADRVAQDGGILLLVVDGLDEDQFLQSGAGSGTSIASLLPDRPPPNLRILVTSRPSPELPVQVRGDHPLRSCRVVELPTTAASRHTEYEAKYDLQEALSGDRLQRDLVGLLTAARGTLTIGDLRELTGEPEFELRRRLGSAFGRILRLRGQAYGGGQSSGPEGYGDDLVLYTSTRGFLFAHETLLTAAQNELGPDLVTYLDRLHAWARSYEERGWPEHTPLYLLQPYGRLLTFLGEAGRLTDLTVNARRRERLREATGSDAACLAEIAAAREAVRRVTPDDLGPLAALAAAGDLVARRNESLHPDIPAVYARLGRVRQAIGLARSVFRLRDRAQAVLGVAHALAKTGDRRAVGLAEEGMRLAEEAARHNDSTPWAAQGALATVLALRGNEEEALPRLRELPRPHDVPSVKAFVKALVMTANVLQDRADAADLLRLAEDSAERIEFLPERVRVLASVAEAWSTCGFPEDATRLCDAVIGLARRDTSDHENLPAVAAEALRDMRPREAVSLASLAAAKLDSGEYAAGGKATYGEVCALVAMDRMPDAHRLAESIHHPGWLSVRLFAWSIVAEGWARRGSANEAWAALEGLWGERFLGGGDDGCTRRVAELLARAGAAEQLEARLLSEAYSAPMGSPPGWEPAEAFAALAGQFAAEDPQRSLDLLHKAEHGHQLTAGLVLGVDQARLAALAGALATAGRPDDAERLVAVIFEPNARAWGRAVVSMAIAGGDPDRALRLAEEALDLALAIDEGFLGSFTTTAALQALGWAGAADTIERLVLEERAPGLSDDRERACAEAAAALWQQDPELAGRLVDDALRDMRGEPVRCLARLLLAVGHHDGDRSARIRRLLEAPDEDHDQEHDEHQVYNRQVLLSLLTAAADPAAARSRLDAVLSEDERAPWFESRARGGAALAYAALGDHERARTMARRGENAEQCGQTFAHLAAYTALLPGECVPVSLGEDIFDIVPLARRLATLLLPPSSGPDLPRARALLAEALTPDGWHHAVPVLAAIDPDAVLRVRDVVFAHLGLSG